MLEYLHSVFGANGALAPHAYCLARPELIWTHVVADALIGLAYFSIPVALAVFLVRRTDMVFGWMMWLFAGFILACGTTHFLGIWTVWHADYGIEALVKAVTAVMSVATAAALWPLIPHALAIPSPEMLKRANRMLEATVDERNRALEALARASEERARTEELLRQSQKLEAIGRLTGGIAHDFNNLLTVVGANLARAQRVGPTDPAEANRSLARAAEGIDRAGRLTAQLLTFARSAPLDTSVQSLVPMLERVGELARRMLPSVVVETDIPSDLWHVRVDDAQAETALLHLVVNARDAMPDGGTLRLAARNATGDGSGEMIEIAVGDTGHGMSDAVQARAFEPFFTTKPVGAGAGLGLAQVYAFARQAGGIVAIDSREGDGTTVSIRLPRAK